MKRLRFAFSCERSPLISATNTSYSTFFSSARGLSMPFFLHNNSSLGMKLFRGSPRKNKQQHSVDKVPRQTCEASSFCNRNRYIRYTSSIPWRRSMLLLLADLVKFMIVSSLDMHGWCFIAANVKSTVMTKTTLVPFVRKMSAVSLF